MTRFSISRRQSVVGLSAFGLGSLLVPQFSRRQKGKRTVRVPGPKLNLQRSRTRTSSRSLSTWNIWAEFYLRATTGQGIPDKDVGPDPGGVVGGHQAQFKNDAIREFVEELAENELAHVRFYRDVLGENAIPRPAIDFEAGFKAAGQAAGLPPDFDPFADDMSVLLGGMLFEDVGVTAYAGAAPLLKKKEFVQAAAGILAVEAYHMGMARSQLYLMGEQAWTAANGISDARKKLDGPEKDQGIRMNGKANVVPSTPEAIAFTRTPQEVLHIVYLTHQKGISKGGFYPNGMNGTLRST